MILERVADPYERAERSLATLRKLGLPPEPASYAVFAAQAAGDRPALTAALEGLVDRPAPPSSRELRALYVEHVMDGAEQALDYSDLIALELRRVLAAVDEADAGAQSYGAVLEGVTAALSTQPGAQALHALVASLAKATTGMRTRTVALERSLAATRGEMDRLSENLTRFREEALTDPLTGLANRKRLDEALAEACAAAEAAGAPLTLILCDIDHFKRVNDAWGHNTGDQVLRFVASALRAGARDGDVVARHGGEEFAIVAPGARLAEGVRLADAVRCDIAAKVLRRRTTQELLGHVTASFGVAELAPDEGVIDLMERADAALYESKNAGRNRVTAAGHG